MAARFQPEEEQMTMTRTSIMPAWVPATLFAAVAIATGITAMGSEPTLAAFPEKPVRLVLGSAAGSGPDIISRVLADRLYGAWNQRVVVDPRPGVAGILSAEIVNRSVPDGYTWMMLTSQLLVASNVFHDHKVDLARDFASVSLVGTVPFVLVVNPTVARTVPELIEAAKKSQPPLRYGSAGTGASEHLCAFLFTRLTRTQMAHVPYKGVSQAVADTISREVHLSFGVLPAVLPMVQTARVRALGVTTRKRAVLLPDVPTIAESVPGYEFFGWYSIVVPTGTPRDVVAAINTEVVKATREPSFGERLKDLGIEVSGTSPAEFDAFRADQTRRINELVKALGRDLN
jgi:tripartite-type tricarboxylate transporter receptor subunit TctC